MGLCKNIHTKLCEGTYVSAAEKRFAGYISPKKKKKVPTKRIAPRGTKDFVTDMLDGLL